MELRAMYQHAKSPNVFIYDQMLDRQQVYKFHNTFDCFVSTHRGEGWGIPQCEAMLLGKPVVSTALGGIHEFMTSEEYYPIGYDLMPILKTNKNPQWYTPDQKWGQAVKTSVIKQLRAVYENPEEAANKAKRAKEKVISSFSHQKIGELMNNLLLQIKL